MPGSHLCLGGHSCLGVTYARGSLGSLMPGVTHGSDVGMDRSLSDVRLSVLEKLHFDCVQD